jgi:fibronectin type III domain protein
MVVWTVEQTKLKTQKQKLTIMSQVKANVSKLNATQTMLFGRSIVTAMTGNGVFPTPAPPLASITSAATALETAINVAIAKRAESKLSTTQMHDAQKALALLITQEGNYVQSASGGDAAKIESAGFEVRNPPAPIGDLPAPADLELDANVNPGHMGMRWTPVTGAASYVVERAPDGTAPLDYSSVANPTSAKAEVNTMTSGTRYWFRVAAVGAAGVGMWTLPVSKVAP